MKKVDCVTPVVYISKLKNYINNFTGEGSLSLEKIYALVDELKRSNITDVEKRREHIRQVRMKK